MQDRQRTYKRNLEALSCSHICRGKVISVTYSECVFVALVIQHANRVRHIILLSVAVFLKALSHKQHDFRKKKILNIKCVFIFSTTFIWIISRSKNSARHSVNVHTS